MSSTPSRKIVILSGGTAANSLVDVFNDLIEKNNCTLTYIIPISDNGGSSSELIRVFGGPGIGDIRSMLLAFLLSYFGFSFQVPEQPCQQRAKELNLFASFTHWCF